MSKIIDITNKLNFDEKPKLVIKGTEIEVNNDAISFIKTVALFDSEDGVKTSDILSALELLLMRRTEKRLQNFISRLPTSQRSSEQQRSLLLTRTARGKLRPRLRLNR